MSIDNAAGVRSASFTFQYNPSLLQVSGASLAGGLPADWSLTVTASNTATGLISVTVSGATPLSGANVPLVLLAASVPSTATYSSLEMLRVTNVAVDVQSGAATTPALAVGDLAIHKNTYLGDADGSGIYTGFDSALVARTVVGLDSGFDAHPWTDPVIVADIVGSGILSGIDTTLIAQKSVSLPTPQIPDLPGISLVPNGGGSLALDTPQTASASAVSTLALAPAIIVVPAADISASVAMTNNGIVSIEADRVIGTASATAVLQRPSRFAIGPLQQQVWDFDRRDSIAQKDQTVTAEDFDHVATVGSARAIDDYFAQVDSDDSTMLAEASQPSFTAVEESTDDCFDVIADDLSSTGDLERLTKRPRSRGQANIAPQTAQMSQSPPIC